MDFSKVIEKVPMHVAYFMAGKVKTNWAGKLQDDARIPELSPRTIAKKGHDAKLLEHNILINSVQAEERGSGEAAVTTNDKRAPELFFGNPQKNLPPRDMFKAAIDDELAANSDMALIIPMLEEFEKEFVSR